MLKLVKVFLYDAGLWFQYSAVVLSKPVTDLWKKNWGVVVRQEGGGAAGTNM